MIIEDKFELEQNIKTAKIEVSNLEAGVQLLNSTSLEKDALISEYEATIKRSEGESKGAEY